MTHASDAEAMGVDPLILQSEGLASGFPKVLAWQPIAEFAVWLAMTAQELEIGDPAVHPEPFMVGVRCGQILRDRIGKEDLVHQVDAYLAHRLELLRVSKGDDWQWQDAFPSAAPVN